MEVAYSIEAVFFSLIGQGIEHVPRGIHNRILLISICFTGAIVYWSYCAGLVSFLTIEKYDFPIKSFQVRTELFTSNLEIFASIISIIVKTFFC